jgi:hypothetical protein
MDTERVKISDRKYRLIPAHVSNPNSLCNHVFGCSWHPTETAGKSLSKDAEITLTIGRLVS